jgi:hypothetical protein
MRFLAAGVGSNLWDTVLARAVINDDLAPATAGQSRSLESVVTAAFSESTVAVAAADGVEPPG